MNFFWWIAALLAASLSAMGVGGGTVLVVYLALFTDLSQKAAQGQNLIFFLPLAAASLYFHAKAGMVRFSIGAATILPGLIGVCAGYALSTVVNDFWLRKAFAVFLLVIGLEELFIKPKPGIQKPSSAFFHAG